MTTYGLSLNVPKNIILVLDQEKMNITNFKMENTQLTI